MWLKKKLRKGKTSELVQTEGAEPELNGETDH